MWKRCEKKDVEKNYNIAGLIINVIQTTQGVRVLKRAKISRKEEEKNKQKREKGDTCPHQLAEFLKKYVTGLGNQICEDGGVWGGATDKKSEDGAF